MLILFAGYKQAGKLEEEGGRFSAAAALYIELGKDGLDIPNLPAYCTIHISRVVKQ